LTAKKKHPSSLWWKKDKTSEHRNKPVRYRWACFFDKFFLLTHTVWKIKTGVITMSMVNMNPHVASQNTARVAKNSEKPRSGKKTADDVLEELREMMPGWTITTNSKDWGEGSRNIEIDVATLNKMAKDPKEMEKYKTLILNLKEAAPEIEEWSQQTGKMFDMTINFNAEGNPTASLLLKSLSGIDELKRTFDLPIESSSSWSEIILKNLNAMIENQTEDKESSRSWMA